MLHAGMENLVRCPDTRAFIGMLHHLEDSVDQDADPPELPEKLAARSLFNLEVGIPMFCFILYKELLLTHNNLCLCLNSLESFYYIKDEV